MALVQVDEADLLSQRAVIDAVNGIMSKPEARRMLLQARKLADPTVSIPELDAAKPVEDGLSEVKRLFAEQKAERAAEQAEALRQRQIEQFERSWNQQKDSLRAAGWQEEGIAQIVQHAQERGIPDLEAAAAHWEKLHPPADPVQPNGSGAWNFLDAQTGEDNFMKKMIDSGGNDDQALNAEIQSVLKDIRQPGARR